MILILQALMRGGMGRTSARFSMDSSHRNSRGSIDCKTDVFISDAESMNLKLFVKKVIKVMRLKFNIKQFKQWMKENIQGDKIQQTPRSKAFFDQISQNQNYKKKKVGDNSALFDLVKDGGTLRKNLKAGNRLQNGQTSIIDEIFSKYIFQNIIGFLGQNHSSEFCILNKRALSISSSLRKKLDISQFHSLPNNIVPKLIKRYRQVESLKIGKFTLNKETILSTLDNVKLDRLKYLDMGGMGKEFQSVIKILAQNTKNIQEVVLPFNYLNDTILGIMGFKWGFIDRFVVVESVHKRSYKMVNKSLSSHDIFNMFCKLQYLKIIELYVVKSFLIENIASDLE